MPPTKQQNPYRLLTPGPVPLHPEVAQILSEPMIHHRTPEFERVFKNVNEKLKDVFSTQESVFIHTATGSGAMESAIVNTLSPGDEVLCIVSGKFGERWAQMAQNYGLKTHILQVPWGEAVSLEKLKFYLSVEENIKAVLTQACETSTATVHPVREIAELVAAREQTILLVDAITAVGAMELSMDDWGLDVVVGGSQKAFMLPTGLSFIAMSKKAWRFYETSRCPKYYWDLKSEKSCVLRGESHFSSAVPLVRALDVVMKYLTGDGKNKTLKRIQNLAQATRSLGECLGLKVFSKSPSPSVTALLTPAGVDSQKLREHMEKEYNLTVMGGQDQLKGKILRIGHLGYITDDDMLALVDVLYSSLRDLGHNELSIEQLKNAKEVVIQCLK